MRARDELLGSVCAAAVAEDALLAKSAFKAGAVFFSPPTVEKYAGAAAALWVEADGSHEEDIAWVEHFTDSGSGRDLAARRSQTIRLLASMRPPTIDLDWFEVIAYNNADDTLLRDLCTLCGENHSSSALFAACAIGDLDLVKMLLARDGRVPPVLRADGRATTGWLADGSIVLHWGGISPWGWHDPSILVAARAGHVDVVRHILCWLRSHPDHANPDQSLMAAIGCGLMAHAVELIADGVDVAAGLFDLSGVDDTFLTVACDRADVEMVTMLLANGADAAETGRYKTPLLCAATCSREYSDWPAAPGGDEVARREAIVRLLLAAGATTQTPSSGYHVPTPAAQALIDRVASAAPAAAP